MPADPPADDIRRGSVSTRREFFRALARGSALAALAALTAALAKRSLGGAPAAGESCSRQGICRGCPALADCGLPQALSARRAATGQSPVRS